MSSDAVSTSFVPTGSKLRPQDLSKLNLSELTPLSPEVISRQATINIGTIGHVAHGTLDLNPQSLNAISRFQANPPSSRPSRESR